jgi:hypothetical protein
MDRRGNQAQPLSVAVGRCSFRSVMKSAVPNGDH